MKVDRNMHIVGALEGPECEKAAALLGSIGIVIVDL